MFLRLLQIHHADTSDDGRGLNEIGAMRISICLHRVIYKTLSQILC